MQLHATRRTTTFILGLQDGPFSCQGYGKKLCARMADVVRQSNRTTAD